MTLCMSVVSMPHAASSRLQLFTYSLFKRANSVSMPHAASSRLQLLHEVFEKEGAMWFQCRTRQVVGCNTVRLLNARPLQVSMPHAASSRLQLHWPGSRSIRILVSMPHAASSRLQLIMNYDLKSFKRYVSMPHAASSRLQRGYRVPED